MEAGHLTSLHSESRHASGEPLTIPKPQDLLQRFARTFAHVCAPAPL
jgi:hypothetical protein